MEPQVIDLASRRAEAAEAERERHIATSMHPALRWVAGSAFYVSHRKEADGAACGARGELTLAPPGVPRCVECWPLAERM